MTLGFIVAVFEALFSSLPLTLECPQWSGAREGGKQFFFLTLALASSTRF
jgi:hypothetical protein